MLYRAAESERRLTGRRSLVSRGRITFLRVVLVAAALMFASACDPCPKCTSKATPTDIHRVSNSNCIRDADSYRDRHSNCDCYRDRNGNRDSDRHRNSNRHCNCNGDADRDSDHGGQRQRLSKRRWWVRRFRSST